LENNANMVKEQQVENTSPSPQPVELPPKKQEMVDDYSAMMKSMIYSDETHKEVVDMLRGNPMVTVPLTSNFINQQAENVTKKTSNPVDLEIVLNSSLFLIPELINLGNTAQLFDKPVEGEQEFKGVVQKSMQMYIQRGIKDGSIDPIELQQQVEPLMGKDQRNQMLQEGGRLGVPAQPTGNMVASQISRTKELEMKKKYGEPTALTRGNKR